MKSIYRRSGVAISVLLALFVMAGCAQRDTDADTPAAGSGEKAAAMPPPAPVGTMKVALITPGPISDKGWNASAHEGVQRIAKELGAEVTPPVEGPAPAEVPGILRSLAQQGHHVIFAHGSEYDEFARQTAAEFPKTTFVITGGRSAGPNLTPIQFDAGQSTYLAGILAAGMSKKGRIGQVGATEIPIIVQAFTSFEKGAKAYRPDITVRTTYTGDEKDVSKGKQAAQALLDGGADVLIHNANAAGLGVFQAVEERPGAMVIGANADQSDLATGKNLGSFILDVPSAILAVGKVVKEGKGQGKPFSAGLKEGAVSLKYNPGFKGVIPEALKARIEQAKQDIIAGKIQPSTP